MLTEHISLNRSHPIDRSAYYICLCVDLLFYLSPTTNFSDKYVSLPTEIWPSDYHLPWTKLLIIWYQFVSHLKCYLHVIFRLYICFVNNGLVGSCWIATRIIKGKKDSFYIAQYPVRWTAQKRFTLFALPDRPVHSATNSASPGSILATQQLRAKTKSLTFPTLSIARYSLLQLSQQVRQWRERKCPIFEMVAKGDSVV